MERTEGFLRMYEERAPSRGAFMKSLLALTLNRKCDLFSEGTCL